ncbi:uncharacterized protein Dwil_GK16538 [Drosophila willistoni]|uniref:Uncharacterized protein n=1 Tax=Drosophila willistoni TaxID=7260 RepID=B4N7X5_DROWI|nr:uncharacterized protein Dwil_GK16538 [Drosophila willistoni]
MVLWDFMLDTRSFHHFSKAKVNDLVVYSCYLELEQEYLQQSGNWLHNRPDIRKRDYRQIDEEHDDDEATEPTRAKSEISDVINGNVHEDERQQQQQQEKSNDEHKDDISKEHTEGGHNEQDHEQLPDDSALNHNNNENELTTPKYRSTRKEEEDDLDMDDDDLEDNDNENDGSHLDEFRSPSTAMDGNLVAASHKDQQGCPFPCISNEERRKRNRTFIDPVTEVPKLEQWFAMNTHPSHNLILKYTEDLNTMPYS